MLSFEVLSKSGERARNEDYVGIQSRGSAYCFVLADGLGGHGGGDEASRLAVEYILNDFIINGEVTEQYLKRCFEGAQACLLQKQKEQGRFFDLKTTLVILLADSRLARWGHIGDSRLYYYKNKKARARTLDHSVPQMLAAAGKIKEKEIRGHADRSRLLRVMGTEWDQPRYELSGPLERSGGEAFLLCSDGFWEWIQDRAMQSALKRSKSPAEWLQRMEKDILKYGTGNSMDNYSAVAVFLD
ncbi:MAG: serine/threonine-protein phosphatase [Eubacterium sp.]|nr:serine/threonine-protein phosphatase [Eubacterium sp.]